MSSPIIDTHIHVWDFSKAEYAWLHGNTSILNRNYCIADLDTERKAAGITEGVLVQAANNFDDTDWMLEVAAGTGWISGVVGWVPLTKPAETERAIKYYCGIEYFKGVRHLIHDEPDDQWLLQDEVIESLRMLQQAGLTYDVVGVKTSHIETALQVAEKLPGLKMVFDHLNQPPIQSKELFGNWGTLMSEAAKHENFYMKISGLGLTAGSPRWKAADLTPYIEFAFTHFGIDRVFCGGDWPVALLAGSYLQTWNTYLNIIDDLLDQQGREKVKYLNARQFYKL